MSLSQKHAGLILVPWFNTDEWRYVYQLVYSNNERKQAKALDLLKIWKIRTPILSIGVEGTLILLDVLLLDSESFSDEQISNLYAVALMRFLNLSAANSEKQGSFTKTSEKNELPKWLTNLRHDIAHGIQIPSKYNLKMGLDFGFRWLKEKYWAPQNKIINDYYIGDKMTLDYTLTSSLQVYTDINLNLFENTDLDDEFYEKIKNMISKKYKNKTFHPYFMLEIFLEMTAQGLEKDHGVETVKRCLDILVSTKAMLKPNFDTVSEEGRTIKINKKFLIIWANLLNLLHRYGLLLCLVDKLFDIIGNISHSKQTKKMASLWINELFLSLVNLIELYNSEEKCALPIDKNNYSYTEQSIEFQKKVLYFGDDGLNQYTVDFLDNLLKYNLSDERFGSDVLNLLKVEASGNLHKAHSKIYTLEDLKVENLSVDDMQVVEFSEKDNFPKCSSSEQIIGGSRWKKIEDTSVFRNCPLGVLPHQINIKHPFLVLT